MEDDDFSIMLKYTEGLRGNARTLTIEKLEKMMSSADSSSEDGREGAENGKKCCNI